MLMCCVDDIIYVIRMYISMNYVYIEEFNSFIELLLIYTNKAKPDKIRPSLLLHTTPQPQRIHQTIGLLGYV